MWVYYVSRGQGICSMGVRDKDHPILEFHSFNKALQTVDQQGFRTFIKINSEIYEPFQRNENEKIKQKMIVSSEELEINDSNPQLGIETNVLYYPLVSEPVPALVRRLQIKNLKEKSIKLELIDGLPRIIPYGVNQNHLKTIARHIEGMMGVNQLDGVPLYRLKQTPADISQVESISGGNFYLSLLDEKKEILRDNLIVDPAIVFAEPETCNYPWSFEESSVEELLSKKQIRENRTPCALTALTLEIPAREDVTLYSIIGNVPNDEKLRNAVGSFEDSDFLRQKREENKRLIREIKNYAFTVSSSPEFDQYCQQDFLDNVIRGGMPLVFDTIDGKSAFYLYSRQNADLERDYHALVLEPTYLSQGNGHYRSVIQNRRSDTWFFPEVEDLNILTFLNLLQTDAYNPLVVTGLTYTAEDSEGLEEWLKSIVDNKELLQELLEMTGTSFTPGEFIMKLEDEQERNPDEYEEIVRKLLSFCQQNDVGELHEGFWIDHWTYNLDLIDSFLAIYPERLKELLIDREIYTYYDNPDIIIPRDEKYVLVDDGKVRQYDAVIRDQEKLQMIKNRSEHPTKARTENGRGTIYKTNLLVKLLSIVANRIATLDPQGIGMEMEADKPGWNDSLNGLPGLLGSSICETLELERLCKLLRESLDEISLSGDATIRLYGELYEFMMGLSEVIEKRLNSKESDRALTYWNKSNNLKEEYREKTKFGISGQEREISINEIKEFLDKCLEFLDGIFKSQNKEKIMDKNGVPYTYFINEVTDHELILEDEEKGKPKLNPSGYPLVKGKKFNQKPVASFLQGPVHALKVHPELCRQIYDGIIESQVYDQKLEMYKSCAPLKDEPLELGRIRAYAPGWIENESIYTHMEYKWLIELLRSGLYEEFYRDVKNVLVPFLDPETYGRSILEGSSFIVSSAFPDESFHGRGFQPRLSGVTAEMLHIWTIMVAGENPFQLDNGELKLKLCPILPSWLFTREMVTREYYDKNGMVGEVEIPENAFAFKFLGKTLVIYHNEDRKDTFGEDRAKTKSYQLEYYNGDKKTINEDTLGAPIAKDVREGKVKQIDVVLA